MDQLTHSVRRSNCINIIQQCQDRPAGTSARKSFVVLIVSTTIVFR